MKIDKRVLKKIIQEEIENMVNEYGIDRPGRYGGRPGDSHAAVKKRAAALAAKAAQARQKAAQAAQAKKKAAPYRADRTKERTNLAHTFGVGKDSLSPALTGGYSPADPQASIGDPAAPEKKKRKAKKQRPRYTRIPASLEDAVADNGKTQWVRVPPKKKRGRRSVPKNVPKDLESALKEGLEDIFFKPKPESDPGFEKRDEYVRSMKAKRSFPLQRQALFGLLKQQSLPVEAGWTPTAEYAKGAPLDNKRLKVERPLPKEEKLYSGTLDQGELDEAVPAKGNPSTGQVGHGQRDSGSDGKPKPGYEPAPTPKGAKPGQPIPDRRKKMKLLEEEPLDEAIYDLSEADLYEQLDPPATEEEKKAAQAALEKEQAEWEAKVARMPSEGDKLSPMQIAALSRNSLDMRIADMRKANQGQAAPASGALKERPLEVDLLEKVVYGDMTAEEAKEQLPEEIHQAFDYFLQKSMELRQQEAEPEDEPEEVPGLEESIYDINESDLFEIDTSCDGIKDHDQRKRCEDARRRNRGY